MPVVDGTAELEALRTHLLARSRVEIRDGRATSCAVLVPLIPTLDGFDVVYTLRAEHLPNHKGQVAFPGGKRHGTELLVETALREAAEEIGIEPAEVAVLGCLDDVSTMAGQYVITPWVGLLPAGTGFRPNPDEVADVFTVSLSRLGDLRYHARTTKTWNDNEYEISTITAGRHEIWGATHQITMSFLAQVEKARRG